MVRAAVVGATGYAGAELVRILEGHPEIELTMVTSRQYAGERFDAIYPAMGGVVDLVCSPYEVEKVCAAADIIFTALPHKLPMGIIPELIKAGKRVVDLSADFRFHDVAAYESAYQVHTATDLIAQSVYGLSEIYADEIRNADIIGNPGCYPTSVLLPLLPLLKEKLFTGTHVIADSKSGVSGAGRSPSLATHFCEVNESYKAYKVAEHRHNSEMEEQLARFSENPVSLTFVPHLVPMTRGMLSTQYLTWDGTASAEDIYDCFAAYYQNRRFVRILPAQRLPDTQHVRGTNFCDIGFRIDEQRGCLILISAIDNLVKGAAGQAVQNMNIMLGLDEATGLLNVPYPV
jgi:N-acetyl-gamma-glutamyl-phosphate reductase